MPTKKNIKRETNHQKINISGSESSVPDQPLEDKLTPVQEKMRVKLATLYAGLGAGLAGFKPYAGIVLIKCAEARAEEVVRACRHSKAAWRWLERIVSSSDVTTCLLGHGIMLYAIMAQMGRLPKNDQLLHMFGYAEEQVMGPPMEWKPDGNANGYTGDLKEQLATGIPL
jgi:hypothetical protein